MNLGRFVTCIKMSIIISLMIILTGCEKTYKYHLDVYYASSCPVCKSFINTVIPELKDMYGDDMLITTFNIDDESSIDRYAKTCSYLENYYVNDSSGSIPFVVLDGYFAFVGYEMGNQGLIIAMIKDAIDGFEIKTGKDIYIFKENMKLY